MKIYVFVGISLDGFIARKDGDIEWLVPFQNEDVEKSYEEFITRIDALVIGKGTFEKVLNFPSWPYDKKVFVLSSSMKQIPNDLTGKVTLLSMHPSAVIEFLDQEGFSNVYVDGGKTIQGFLQEDCVDELTITQVPVLIGNGIRLFGDPGQDLFFNHIRTSVFANGLVKSQYEKKRT